MHKVSPQAARPSGVNGEPVFLRHAHVIAGVTYPFWYLLTPPGLDAWWTWCGVSFVFLISAGLAPSVPFLQRQLRNMFPGPWLSTLHVYLLAWLNDMHLFYTVGSVMAVLAVSMMITSKGGLAAYGFFVGVLGLGLFVLDPDSIKAACWGGLLPAVVIAYQRLSMSLTQAQLADDYRNQLEHDVAERTSDLSETNLRLQREMEERTRLEEELRLAHKLEAVGRLAGGIAHEFNNLLTRIRLYADLAVDNEPAESGVRDDVGEIQKAGRQAAVLTRQLLAFSRQGDVQSEIVDLNDIVESCSLMVQHLLGEAIELVVLPGDGPLALVADRDQLEHVLVNLTLNARDAMPEGGRLTIETTAITRDELTEGGLPDLLREPEYVLLTFTDTGVGMDPETRARAFDPFFTRKSENSGTGLGLSIVYGILNRAGGHVRAWSEPGKGARFELYWARIHELPSEAPAPANSREICGGEERILLVEDEVDLRLALERLLCSSGYAVLPAKDAAMALRIATEATEPIHLLLSDVVMPGMSGLELADKVRAARPDTRVLLISGHMEPRTGSQPAVPQGIGFLAKPFDSDDLMVKIRQVLEAPSGS